MVTRSLDTLQGWDKNPRSITKDAYERLKEQLKLGQHSTLLVTKTGVVLGGNMRLKAMKDIGITEAKCIEIEFKEAPGGYIASIDGQDMPDRIFKTLDNAMMEYSLSHNDRAGFYDEELFVNIKDNFDIDWSKYAVDFTNPTPLSEMMDRFNGIVEDDVPPLSKEPAISKLGEVYQLGKHRVMCGDSTKLEDVTKLMNGHKADMVFTDPPYNMSYEGGGESKREGILNDKMSKDAFYKFLYDAIVNILAFSKGSNYICIGSKEIDTLKVAYEQAGGHFQNYIIWVKNRFTLSGSDYQNQYEAILYGWKDKEDHYFIDDRAQGVIWNEIDKRAKYVDGKTEIKIGTTTILIDGKATGQIIRGKRKTDIWEYNRPEKSSEHPTMKPIKLVEEAIKNSSVNGQIVMDLFLGSGTTLIAAEQTDRICYGMELDPQYVDVIRKRYAKFIDKEANWLEVTSKV